MIPTKHTLQSGFSAVELLITLFIASIFLFAGFQLYTQVTRDSKDAGYTSKLSGMLYEKLQTATSTATAAYPNGCVSASASSSTNSEQVEGIGSVTFTTTVSCPQGASASADLFLIKVKASYTSNGVAKELEHAIYAN